jgi:hypothetical protein
MTTETEKVDRLVEESSYVFKATVMQVNASNEPAVRPCLNPALPAIFAGEVG